MNRFLVYAVLLITLPANAEGPLSKLVQSLVGIQTGKMTFKELISGAPELELKVYDEATHSRVPLKFIRVVGNATKRNNSVILASPSKSGIEVLVGAKNETLLDAYKAQVNAKALSQEIADKTILEMSEIGIMSQAINLGKKATVVAEQVGKRAGLSEGRLRALFSADSWETISMRFGRFETENELHTFVRFRIGRDVDAGVIETLLRALDDLAL